MLIFLIYLITAQAATGQRVDAYWGPWGKWSKCSRTCGGGVTKSTRICISNIKNTSLSCSGDHNRYQMCNIQDCPDNSVDYRMLQCSNFNSKPYKGKYYKWAGFSHSAGECELKCMPKNNFFYVTFDAKVADGTRCNDYSNDVCINGTCVPVGCDMQLHSKARVDNCGICNGDDSKCKIMKGTFKLVKDAYGYVDVVTVPAGATSVKITEDYKTTNFLAVTSNGKNILNADYAISSSFGTRKYQGLLIRYERSGRLNQIKIDGPIDLPLQFHVYVARYTKRSIIYNYEYYMPNSYNEIDNTINSYSWIIGDWSKCSKRCASGKRTRVVYCAKKNSQTKVEDFNCDGQKPSTKEECNAYACPPRWYISQWSPCSRSCGKGFHTRRVHCVETVKDGNIKMLSNGKCPGKTPVQVETCYEKKSCPDWQTSDWTKCTKSCGNGFQTRVVSCVDHYKKKVGDDECSAEKRPDTRQECHNFPCGAQWVVEQWSQCSSLCSVGMRHRKVTCNNRAGIAVPRTHCNPRHEPAHFENCQVVGPCKPMWHASEWSECSAQCGYGMQIRVVTCAEKNGNNKFAVADEKYCDSLSKPQTSRRCTETKPCQVNYFVSKWRKCTVSCGVGYQMRDVRCYADRQIDYSQKHCANLIKPTNVRICKQPKCPVVEKKDDNEVESVYKTSSPTITVEDKEEEVTPTEKTIGTKGTSKVTKTSPSKKTDKPVEVRRRTPAKIIYFHGPDEIQVNAYAEFKCVANGYPNPGVRWSYGGRSVADAFHKHKITRKLIDYNKEENVLYVQHSKVSPAKELMCNVRNIYGQDESVLQVKVTDLFKVRTTELPTERTTEQDHFSTTEAASVTQPVVEVATVKTKAPVFVTKPGGGPAKETPAKIVSLSGPVKLESGENADYQCIAGGNPIPKITWKLNGKSFDPARFRVLYSKYGSRLVVLTATYSDTGDLKCIATNALGSDSSKLSIKISGVPLVSIYPKKEAYKEGTHVSLTCRAEGSPTPQISWGKDGRIFFGDNKRVIVLQDRIIFNGILPKDSGKYFCKGFNSQGTNVDSLSVSIERSDGTRINTCEDDNTRADCRLIASLSRLCSIPHYNLVCCETCRGRV